MSIVNRRVEELKQKGVFSAEPVESSTIFKIINMAEWEYYGIETETLESYLGLLAQQVQYVQQECNISAAREIELGNSFKVEALPYVLQSKIRSVEERWIFASTLDESLRQKFEEWQCSVIEAKLKKDLSESIIEKLQVLKKIYDDRRMEGKNRNIHKYTDGSFGGVSDQ